MERIAGPWPCARPRSSTRSVARWRCTCFRAQPPSPPSISSSRWPGGSAFHPSSPSCSRSPWCWCRSSSATCSTGIIGRAVEELYFRGHLLPRIDRLGAWAPVVKHQPLHALPLLVAVAASGARAPDAAVHLRRVADAQHLPGDRRALPDEHDRRGGRRPAHALGGVGRRHAIGLRDERCAASVARGPPRVGIGGQVGCSVT